MSTGLPFSFPELVTFGEDEGLTEQLSEWLVDVASFICQTILRREYLAGHLRVLHYHLQSPHKVQ